MAPCWTKESRNADGAILQPTNSVKLVLVKQGSKAIFALLPAICMSLMTFGSCRLISLWHWGS